MARWSGGVFSHLRARLLSLVLLVLLPAFVLIVYTAMEQRRLATTAAHEDALRLARIGSDSQKELIEDARRLLTVLAHVPEVRGGNAAACQAFFADLLQQFPRYTTIGAATPRGEVFCSGVPLRGPVTVTDRAYFRRTLETRAFTVGEYVIGRITGQPVLTLAQPVLDTAGTVRAVIFVGLSLEWLGRLGAESRLPPGSTMTLIDHTGTILARVPDSKTWVGKTVAETPIARTMLQLRRPGEGTARGRGVDGVERLYAFTSLGDTGERGAVSVGIPTAVAFADVDRMLARNLLGLGVVALLGLGAAWVGTDLVVLRRVHALVGATKRLAGGDLRARAGLPHDPGELGHLARAFDEMAEALQARQAEIQQAEAELRRVNRTLRVLSAGNHVLVHAASEAALLQAVCDVIVNKGAYRLAWVGVAEADEAKTVRPVAHAGHEAGYLDTVDVTWAETDRGRGPVGTAIRTGTPAVVRTITDDSRFAPWRAEGATQRGYASMIALPLMVGGRTVGALAIYAAEPDAFDPAEVALLTELTEDLAYGIGALRTAAERQRAEASSRDSEALFRSTFEDSGIGMALQAPDGRYLRVNRALCGMLGYSAEELRATTFQAPTHPDDRDADVDYDRRMLAGEIGFYQTEKRYLHKGGHVVWVLATVSLLRNSEGRPLYFVAQVQDITDRKRAAEEQARLQVQFAQSEKLATLGQLLAGVAHELNNPLAVVVGRAALLAQKLAGGPLERQTAQIEQAAERCARIVKNFLALARQQPMERRPVSLNQVVQEAVELLAYPLRVDNVDVRLELAPDLPRIWADSNQLHQVVVNLVSNAHQAMRETAGARRITLTTRADPATAQVRLEVADTGPGIPPDIQRRIFEPFFTTKPPGEGTGLGLSLCQGIVERHGGVIRVESAPGQGAVFRIDLPVDPRPDARPEASSLARLSVTPKQTMLIVDDEADVAEMLADLLRLDGHRVEIVTNGRLALDALRERTYDLILSDIKMPELDGPGLYQALERQYPDILRRIVFLSGDRLSPDIHTFLERTRAPSLNKPFTLDEVRRVVRRVASGP